MTTTFTTPPIALTIAGSDSSGGAGIQADLKTFTVHGVYGASVITALTAQNTTGVQAVHAVPAEFVAAQMRSVMSDLRVSAIKSGMLANAAIIRAVADALAQLGPAIPLVLDPVMVATSGDVLLAPDAIDTLKSALIPQAALITPNLPEAAELLGTAIATSEAEARHQLDALAKLGARAVLLKGGHGKSGEAVDFLAANGDVMRLASPRIATQNTHGTGCTLSAAIAAQLALGAPLETAVTKGKDYVHRAIEAGSTLRIGAGNGPVNHLVRLPDGN